MPLLTGGTGGVSCRYCSQFREEITDRLKYPPKAGYLEVRVFRRLL